MNSLLFRLSLLMSLLLLAGSAFSQQITQTIRGQVLDMQSQVPLPGVTVVLLETSPPVGAVTDVDGYFRIENVPVGRVSLEMRFIGYQPVLLQNLALTSGKELVLKAEMEEQLITTGEVVVRASRDKTKPLNEMATISARTFSVEESQRYAGARNDVSRMASNFAGVRGSNDAVNDIVIRGNSPNGLLWRLEGVDIPNPNHFGEFGGTGGPVSMLNNNVLSNSDFLTGAFPAQYANALSGVFDLQMRNGNEEQREFLGQIGFNGFEFGAEGPISKSNRSSYLINYRYSTLGVMESIGIDFGTGTAVPEYQDLSFKFNFPIRGKGQFSVFGLGGRSNIDLVSSDSGENDDNLYSGDDQDVYTKTNSGIVGLSQTYIFNPKMYVKATVAASGIQNQDVVDSISLEDRSIHSFYNEDNINTRLMTSLLWNYKLNARHNFRAGIYANQLRSNVQDSVFRSSQNRFEVLRDVDANTWLLQPYAHWQMRFSERLTFNTGLSMQYLAQTNSFSPEPRLGVKWSLSPVQSLSFGYGLHTQIAPLLFFHRQVRQADGSYAKPNTDLDFTRAHHLVLGYDWIFTETMRLKVETYYQEISDAIVEVSPSSYSNLNSGSFTTGIPDSLNNGGSGRNIGLELTLEKFLDRGLYYLVTASLYDSEYTGSDDVTRKTAFAGNYVLNVLGGKEFVLNTDAENRKQRNSITVDLKTTVAGGQRYTPIDLELSRQVGDARYIEDEAFSQQFRDYFRFDVRVAFRMESRKFSQEWAFDVQNVTNQQNLYFQRYNARSGNVEDTYQLGLFPIVQYKIEF